MKPKYFEGVPDHNNWAVGPCETPEIAKEVLRIAHEKSGGELRWVDEAPFIVSEAWTTYEREICYFLFEGQYGDMLGNPEYKYISPADFIRANGGVVPLSPAEYWKTRCGLAEKIMNDLLPKDMSDTQLDAYGEYYDFIKAHQEPK